MEAETAKNEPSAVKKCPFCAEEIKVDAIVCKFCQRDLAANQPQPNTGSPVCQACGGAMKKKKEATSEGAGCVLLVIGFFLLFLFPIGTIIGIILLLVGLRTASKRRGLWVCRVCGHQIEREIKWYEFG